METVTCSVCGAGMYKTQTFCAVCKSPRSEPSEHRTGLKGLWVLIAFIAVVMAVVILKASGLMG